MAGRDTNTKETDTMNTALTTTIRAHEIEKRTHTVLAIEVADGLQLFRVTGTSRAAASPGNVRVFTESGNRSKVTFSFPVNSHVHILK
jgi:hypothetical protein